MKILTKSFSVNLGKYVAHVDTDTLVCSTGKIHWIVPQNPMDMLQRKRNSIPDNVFKQMVESGALVISNKTTNLKHYKFNKERLGVLYNG